MVPRSLALLQLAAAPGEDLWQTAVQQERRESPNVLSTAARENAAEVSFINQPRDHVPDGVRDLELNVEDTRVLSLENFLRHLRAGEILG
jgi:hypothetical protein